MSDKTMNVESFHPDLTRVKGRQAWTGACA